MWPKVVKTLVDVQQPWKHLHKALEEKCERLGQHYAVGGSWHNYRRGQMVVVTDGTTATAHATGLTASCRAAVEHLPPSN